MASNLKSKAEWKKMKRIIVRRHAMENLRLQDRENLKTFRNEHNKGLLHIAAKHAFLEVNEYLIETGCEVNLAEIKRGNTPLIYALNREDGEGDKIVELLLKSGAHVSYENIIRSQVQINNGKKFDRLYSALKSWLVDAESIANYLLRKGWTLDNIACLRDNEIIKCVLSSNQTLMANCKSMFNAITHGDVLLVKFLLEPLVHIERITSWALLKAARSQTIKSPIIIKLLLDKGASIHGFPGDQRTPLEVALMLCNVDNTLVLLENGARVQDLKIFGLLRARPRADYNARMCIRLLIEYQGLWNGRDEEKTFENIFWLTQEYWTDLSILNVVVEYLSKERLSKGPDDDYIPAHYKHFRKDYMRCSEVLCDMKKYVLENVIVSDLAVKKIDALIPYTRNSSLTILITKTPLLYNIFRRHIRTLQFKVKKAHKKRLLIDQSIDVLSKCLPFVGSLHPVLERIVYFLGVPNLLTLEENDFLSLVFD